MSFFYDPITIKSDRELFEKKKNFVFIGNFMHKPNLEAVNILL